MNIPAGEPPKKRSERVLEQLRKPKLRFVRIPAGFLLVFGGLAGFLPVLGFWMVPVGLTVLAIDFPAAERLLQKMRRLACGLRRWTPMLDERTLRRALIVIALAALAAGLIVTLRGHHGHARWIWAAGTVPVAAALAMSIFRGILAGRMGVDAVAFLSMAAALALGQSLAGVVVAIMYAGGNVLEDYAVGRAERDLKALVDRAPRVAHRRIGGSIEEVPIEHISIGDTLLVMAGEVIPVDGLIIGQNSLLDESAVTGEPIPVARRPGEAARSGAVNAGEALEMRASATASESTYAGIVRLATAAQTAKAPFIRMADRYALILLPVTLLLGGAAWIVSHDPVRGLAVLVAATPCPLILAAPVAFIAGTAQAARRGILIKGGGPLEALARTHTAMFDKTGTLTVGGARLVAVETAPGEDPDQALRLAASLEQASHHIIAAAIVAAARGKGLMLQVPEKVRETMGSGLEGVVGGRKVSVGSHQLVYGGGRLEEWALRALRRASWRSALSVFVSVEGRTIAALLLADELRRETPRAVQALRAAGVSRIVMVTGDRADAAETIGAALDLDAVLADRVPADKVDAVATEQRLHPTLMVGDGINDAPALAAADVGIAMGARGASASSEAADVVILVDQLDRVPDAVAIARRTRGIALQSIIAGMSLSAAAMGAAAFGWLTPVAGALTQEVIDVAVILNALRALSPGRPPDRLSMPAATARDLRQDHERLEASLDRLRQIADALDEAVGGAAVGFILEANRIVAGKIAVHEREDQSSVYPRLAGFLSDNHGLCAMSRAHREILHLARLLARLSDALRPHETDRYLIRDAQRIIESIESLVRLHNAQEEDIYEHAVDWRAEVQAPEAIRPDAMRQQAVAAPSLATSRWRWRAVAGALVILAAAGGVLSWSRLRHGAVHYVTEKVERGSILRTLSVTGKVRPDRTVPIGAHVAGVIQALHCEINSKVEAGELCAKIDPHPFQAAIENERAQLATAEGRLEKDKAALAEARALFKRHQTGAKRGTVSRATLSMSRRASKEAEARASLDEAAVARHKAALWAAETGLGDTGVVAPMGGTVVSRNVDIGQTVAAGAPLFLIAPVPTAMLIDAKVSASGISDVKPGDKASFTVKSLPDKIFAGEVTKIGPAARGNGNATAYDVVIRAPNPDRLLEPGMSAAAEIVVERRDGVLRVPAAALRFSVNGFEPRAGGAWPENSPRLWVLREGKPTAIAVEPGLGDGNYTEIVKGDLQPGDALILGEDSGTGRR